MPFETTAKIMKARVLVQLVAGGTKSWLQNCGWRKAGSWKPSRHVRENACVPCAMCHIAMWYSTFAGFLLIKAETLDYV